MLAMYLYVLNLEGLITLQWYAYILVHRFLVSVHLSHLPSIEEVSLHCVAIVSLIYPHLRRSNDIL